MEDSLYCYDNPDPFFELVYLVRELISSRTLLTSSPRLLLAPLFRTCEATWPALMYCHPRRAYHRTHCCRYPQRRRYVFLMRLTRILLGARSTEGERPICPSLLLFTILSLLHSYPKGEKMKEFQETFQSKYMTIWRSVNSKIRGLVFIVNSLFILTVWTVGQLRKGCVVFCYLERLFFTTNVCTTVIVR